MSEETTDALEARIATLERRARSGEGRASMETAFWALMRNLFPDETRRHMKAAGREQLLAARSYLDHWIAKMGDDPAASARDEREKIDVE